MSARRTAVPAFLTGPGAIVSAPPGRVDGIALVTALHRFLNTALANADDLVGLARAADESLAALRSNASSITFLRGEVIVGGKLLGAPRAVLEAALAIGAALERVGAAEIAIDAEIDREELVAFARRLALALRVPDRKDELFAPGLRGIAARPIDPIAARVERPDASAREKIATAYAAAIAVGRELRAAIARGAPPPLARLKRAGQRLVELAETNDPAFIGLTTLAAAHRDDEGRAAQTAVLAIAIGRQITNDRRTLARLALAALTLDLGTSGVLATAGVSFSSALRSVVAVEVLAMERMSSGEDPRALAALYGGAARDARLESRVVHAARGFLDRLAPRDGSRGKSPFDALAVASEQRAFDPAVFRCLVRAIGVAPAGSVVELDDGSWAVIVGDSLAGGVNLDRPRVRVVADSQGRALETPNEIDLGRPGSKSRSVARFVDPAEARFNVARVFLG